MKKEDRGYLQMTKQIELFSAAIAHKQKALDALQKFAFRKAKTHLEIALEIDPYLADLTTLLQATKFLLNRKVHAKTEPPGLLRAWQKVEKAGAALPRAVHAIVEPLICERMVQCLPPDYTDFVDPKEKTLHIGYCYLELNRFEQAHEKLLDYLTAHPEESHPRLWGYFGDAAYKLNRREECNSGYLRALFMDAQSVDLERLRHPALHRIYRNLQRRRLKETARALMPIYCWLAKVLHIPKGNTLLARVIQKQRFDHSARLLLYPDERYHQFALCLYIDQSGMHGDIDFDARTEMQRLDARLFRRYLEVVGSS
ncbi:MAG: hypothetical protein ACE5IR_14355 [bacterium]